MQQYERIAKPDALILIADDDRDSREMYALYLGMIGNRVELAKDGERAVVKPRRLRPDLIVMDLEMPTTDGWRAIRDLQSRPETQRTPIIVISGHDFKAFLEHSAMAEGAVGYLMKPCFPERLAREISARLAAVKRSESTP